MSWRSRRRRGAQAGPLDGAVQLSGLRGVEDLLEPLRRECADRYVGERIHRSRVSCTAASLPVRSDPHHRPGKVCGKPRISVSDGPDAVLPSRADPSLMVTTSLAERLAAPGARP